MGVESSTDYVQENATSHFHNDQQELHKMCDFKGDVFPFSVV